MIRIDAVQFISCALSIFLLLVFILWIFYNYKDSGKLSDNSENLAQCPYCTFVFFEYKKEALSVCPRCKSYINTAQETSYENNPIE